MFNILLTIDLPYMKENEGLLNKRWLRKKAVYWMLKLHYTTYLYFVMQTMTLQCTSTQNQKSGAVAVQYLTI